MGQAEVYDAIKALGGRATYAQIRDYLCARGYCENSIHTPLRRLKHNGSVQVRFDVLPVPLYVALDDDVVDDVDNINDYDGGATAAATRLQTACWPGLSLKKFR